MGTNKEGPSNFKYVIILTFSNIILLRSLRTCSLMKKTMTFEIFLKIFIDKFTTIVRYQNLDNGRKLCSHNDIEGLKCF